jgi:hypothetical protein
MQMGKDWFWVNQEEGIFIKKNMKVISQKLENAKHEQFDDGDIEYFRRKVIVINNSDLMKIQELFIKFIKTYGEKVSSNNFNAVSRLEVICEKELKKRGAPKELTRDSFRNKKFDIKRWY